MTSIFASPMMLWGLFATGGLAAIYVLRMRSRRVVVSSLLPWLDHRMAVDGGRSVRRIRTPLLFFIELLAILLLVLAASGLRLPRGGSLPLIVVLDDSYSMRAGEGDGVSDRSPRVLAMKELARVLGSEPIRANVIVAGRRPVLLGQRFDTPGSLETLEPRWRCEEPTADLASAIMLARQLDASAYVLVLTDHPPAAAAEGRRLRIVATGAPRANLAIIGAVRRDGAQGGKAVIEVANYSSEPTTVNLLVKMGPAELEKPLEIAAGEISRLALPLPADAPPIEILLPDDAISADNRAVLLPDSPAILCVDVAVQDDVLSEAITRAVMASGRARISSVKPHVRFVMDRMPKATPGCWDVAFIGSDESKPILGPFVLDKHHPLLEGMTLEGVVLSQDEKIRLGGRPLVAAADATLMCWQEMPSGNRRVWVQCQPKMTTWLDSIDFPVWIANVLTWRETALPERVRPNVRIGEKVQVTLAAEREKCVVTTPEGEVQPLTPLRREVTFECDTPGTYELALDDSHLSVAANVLFRDESDVTAGTSDEWGKWDPADVDGFDYWSAAVPLLFAVLLAWVIHGLLLTLSQGRLRLAPRASGRSAVVGSGGAAR